MAFNIDPDLLIYSLTLAISAAAAVAVWKGAAALRHFLSIRSGLSSRQILNVITDIQKGYISHKDSQTRHRQVFRSILENLLELSQSEYGFIAEIVSGGHEHTGLKVHALYNMDWTDADQSYYDTLIENGLDLLDRDLITALNYENEVCSHTQQDKLRHARFLETLPSLPEPLNNVLITPLFGKEDELVGAVCLANSPYGFSRFITTAPGPDFKTAGTMILSLRNHRDKDVAQVRLSESIGNYRQTLTRLQGIMDNTDALITLKDHDGRYLLANRKFHDLFGGESGNVTGKRGKDLFGQEYADQFTNGDEIVLGQSRPARVEEEAILPDGRTHYYLSAKFPLHDEAMNEDVICSISTDITEQKLYERKIHEAKTQAEEANRAKSRFLANITHEIRTPMNGIIGTAELLSQTRLDKKQQHYTTIISQSGETLLCLINDILDLSKLEAGKLETYKKIVDLQAFVKEITSLFMAQASEKTLDLRQNISPACPDFIITDPARTKQIISNFVSNAIKFTPAGHVTISADVTDNNELEFSVSDTGIGITAQDQKRIFETFSQVNSDETQNETSGTGLGLSICKALAEALGGQIGVESLHGAGSRFWFSIPLEKSSPAAFQAQESKDEGLVSARYHASILLAEDVTTNQMIFEDMIGAFGLTPDIASNGQEAVNLASQNNYDLIFMDLRMPVMDGLDATKAIRQGGKNMSTPVVALTAYAIDESRKGCIEAGMSEFATKPISRRALSRILNQYLNAPPPDEGDTQGLPFLQEMYARSPDKAAIFASAAKNDLESRIDMIKTALEKEAVMDVAEAAHGMKSVARDIGAESFADMAAQIEKLARHETLSSDLYTLVDMLGKEYEQLQDLLKSFVR